MNAVTDYHNSSNGRFYRLEIDKDLLGDIICVRYFGHRKMVACFKSLIEATQYYEVQHQRRISRGYVAL